MLYIMSHLCVKSCSMGCGASSSPAEVPAAGEVEAGGTGEEGVEEEEEEEEEDIADKVEVKDVNNNAHRPKTSNPNNDR